MTVTTNRRRALAGLLATPFAAACATTAPPIDGTYLESGDSNFNNPNNWSSKAVPTGTATIALTQRITTIDVTADWTLAEIRLSRYAPLLVPKGRTVTVSGAGVQMIDYGSVVADGTLTGAVVAKRNATLYGHGTINGNVTTEAATLAPGGLQQTDFGTLTINGSYTQANNATLMLRLVGPNLSRVNVTNAGGGSGRAVLGQDTFLNIWALHPVRRGRGQVPILTTTNGLTGRFHTEVLPWGQVEYDNNNAYLVW
jgi:fibronectin-binding autotransporter adhesin